jgi:NAD(P)H-dependent flavin oxidoreductase YrpB (nitropropane dioxygenase family)
MPVIETALTQLLGIEHPILLAPMGSAAGSPLPSRMPAALALSAPAMPMPMQSARS